jgi:hypothetical protein
VAGVDRGNGTRPARSVSPAGAAAPASPWAFGTGLIAAGDRAGAGRAPDFLFGVQQKPDGSFPQNSQVDGTPVWGGLQLDEVALPIVPAADFLVSARWPARPAPVACSPSRSGTTRRRPARFCARHPHLLGDAAGLDACAVSATGTQLAAGRIVEQPAVVDERHLGHIN